MDPQIIVKPSSLRDKLRYTDNADGIRDKCTTIQSMINYSMRQTMDLDKSLLDLLIFGSSAIPVPLED